MRHDVDIRLLEFMCRFYFKEDTCVPPVTKSVFTSFFLFIISALKFSSCVVSSSWIIFPFRPNWEGGQYDGDESTRQEALRLAMELGADYIDVELQVAS